jgi:hypothetical protein
MADITTGMLYDTFGPHRPTCRSQLPKTNSSDCLKEIGDAPAGDSIPIACYELTFAEISNCGVWL